PRRRLRRRLQQTLSQQRERPLRPLEWSVTCAVDASLISNTCEGTRKYPICTERIWRQSWTHGLPLGTSRQTWMTAMPRQSRLQGNLLWRREKKSWSGRFGRLRLLW
ncbi:hypothetical protein FOZ63_024707, partial [Perkinsus olseni]